MHHKCMNYARKVNDNHFITGANDMLLPTILGMIPTSAYSLSRATVVEAPTWD